MASRKWYKLVLIGRKGDGKSATGNTVLGEPLFQPSVSANSLVCVDKTSDHPLTSSNAKAKTSQPPLTSSNAKVTVIDTPGLFNTDIDKKDIESELSKIFDFEFIAKDGGIDAFLFVLRIGRFTAELRNTIKYCQELFGTDVMKYSICVFTGLDDLEFDGDNFQDYIAQLPEDIAAMLPKIRLSINNRAKDDLVMQAQRAAILQAVDTHRNSTKKYTYRKLPRESSMKCKPDTKDVFGKHCTEITPTIAGPVTLLSYKKQEL
ncbi:uncharacterized protein [Amphiura filiformis]|uniref:uncharacterized protein n=1 Tax=Amphiura filiformis TaxID=82378 RepID=UPI003B21737F